MPICRAASSAITETNWHGSANGIPRESLPLRFLLILDSVHVLFQMSDGSRFSYQFCRSPKLTWFSDVLGALLLCPPWFKGRLCWGVEQLHIRSSSSSLASIQVFHLHGDNAVVVEFPDESRAQFQWSWRLIRSRSFGKELCSRCNPIWHRKSRSLTQLQWDIQTLSLDAIGVYVLLSAVARVIDQTQSVTCHECFKADMNRWNHV
jgi:hypothetical protein